MDKINFIELFHSKELELPIKSFDKDAYIILKDLFDVYINLLEEYNLDKRDIKKSKEQCIHIKKAIEFYYLGNPVKAYDEIKTVLDNLYNNNQLILYKKNERFSRYSNNNDPLNLYRV